jgi:shikimate kinase
MRIFLTGFMGAGKSFLGKLWAEDNNLPFYDLDALIEEEERTTIDKIFAEKGEAYFREKEAAVLRNTERFKNAIIACGGGAPCFFDNMHWMNKNGVTVFLNESIENIFHHLINDKKQRPLLLSRSHEDLETIIKEKLEERLPFYLQSKVILGTDNLHRNGFKIIDDFLKEYTLNA